MCIKSVSVLFRLYIEIIDVKLNLKELFVWIRFLLNKI